MLLITSRLPWLNRPHILIAALLLVLVPPISDEVWLSSIGSQVHLSLCAALVLALEDRVAAPIASLRLTLLALAALSGPGSWLLLPLFILHVALERSRPRAVQALVLGIAVAVQLGVFYSHDPGRHYAIHPVLFLDLAFDKHLILPFPGPHHGVSLTRLIEAHAAAGRPLFWPAAACLCLVVAAATLLATDPHDASFWLFNAAAVAIAVSYAGALGPFVALFHLGFAGRYCYEPQALLSLTVLACRQPAAADTLGRRSRHELATCRRPPLLPGCRPALHHRPRLARRTRAAPAGSSASCRKLACRLARLPAWRPDWR